MTRRIVDLTLPIHEGMTTFPTHWHPRVEVTVLGRLETENRETRKLVLGTHTGTHCDAPRHFVEGGRTIDQLSLDTFVGPARVLNLSAMKPRQEITGDEIKRLLGEERPVRLILRFDWSKQIAEHNYYTDYPFLSVEAARLLVDRQVKLIATDVPSLDNPLHDRKSNLDSPIHKILLNQQTVLVEYLCNLDQLQHDHCELIVMPLKIRDGDGAPVRCVAIETDAGCGTR